MPAGRGSPGPLDLGSQRVQPCLPSTGTARLHRGLQCLELGVGAPRQPVAEGERRGESAKRASSPAALPRQLSGPLPERPRWRSTTSWK